VSCLRERLRQENQCAIPQRNNARRPTGPSPADGDGAALSLAVDGRDGERRGDDCAAAGRCYATAKPAANGMGSGPRPCPRREKPARAWLTQSPPRPVALSFSGRVLFVSARARGGKKTKKSTGRHLGAKAREEVASPPQRLNPLTEVASDRGDRRGFACMPCWTRKVLPSCFFSIQTRKNGFHLRTSSANNSPK